MASLFRPTKPVPLPASAEIVEKDGKPHVRIGEGKKAVLYPLTADRAKYLRPSRKWYGKFTDGTGTERRVPLTADKSAARMMLAELVRKAERQRIGLFDPAEDHARRPIAEHVSDYETHLRAKGNCAAHVESTVTKIQAIAAGCGFVFLFVFLREIDATKVGAWLHALRQPKAAPALQPNVDAFTIVAAAAVLNLSPAGVRAAVQRNRLPAAGSGKARRLPRSTVQTLADKAGVSASPATVNHYIRAVRGFVRWLRKDKRIASDPLELLGLLNEKTDVRRAAVNSLRTSCADCSPPRGRAPRRSVG